jgi:hypothetical protein
MIAAAINMPKKTGSNTEGTNHSRKFNLVGFDT